MKYSKAKHPSKINGLFQEITGSFYLIPNIKKCLNRILETINCELSLFASTIYYNPPNGKKIVVKNHLSGDRNLSSQRIYELSEIIFKENYPVINSIKRVCFNKNLEACIIPIRCETNHFGLMILFNDHGSFSPDNIIEEFIGIYVTAACMGNHLIMSKTKALNTKLAFRIDQEISVKKLLEWRIQEIINSFFDQLLPDQTIYQEISRETEKVLIMTALKGTDNNQSKAARFLGINRNTLRKKIRDLKIN